MVQPVGSVRKETLLFTALVLLVAGGCGAAPLRPARPGRRHLTVEEQAESLKRRRAQQAGYMRQRRAEKRDIVVDAKPPRRGRRKG